MRVRSIVVASIGLSALSACPSVELKEVPLATWSETRVTQCIPDPAKVDVLLVIDDSASMGTEANALAENLGRIMEVYDAPDGALDFRIAVTTADVANPWCDSSPEDGAFVATSCRERLGDFTASPSHESNVIDVREACVDRCVLGEVPIVPTTTALDGTARPRPWIQRDRGRYNLPPDVHPVEALTCLGQVGIAGCTFESPLEAAYLALQRARDPADPAYGFVRPDAALFVLFVGDEDDCTVQPEHVDIFDPEGARTFWGAGAEEATSAICWNAGMQCVGDPSWYEDCFAADDGPMRSVERYIALLEEIELEKQHVAATNERRVFVHAVVGGPIGIDSGVATIAYQASSDPAVQATFGIAPGCTNNALMPVGTAMPPGRIREMVERFAEPDRSGMASICGADFTGALACVPGPWARLALGCVDICVDVAGGSCVLRERRSSQEDFVVIPACVEDETPLRDLDPNAAPGEGACVEWLTGQQRRTACIEEGYNVEYRIHRERPLREGSCVEVVCPASPEPDIDCPDR